MQPTSHTKTIVLWGVVAGIFGLILWKLAAVLAPFVVAAVLAYALTPVVDGLYGLVGRQLPRWLLVLLVEVVFLALLLSVALLMVPIVATELPLIRSQLPALLARAGDTLQPLAVQWSIPLTLDREAIQSAARSWLTSHAAQGWLPVLESLKLGGSFLVGLAGNLVLIPVVLFYLLSDWQALMQRLTNLVPVHWRPSTLRFVADANAVLGQYLRGQLLVMGLLAIYYSVSLSLFGLELALPIGVFTGLAIFVPYLGFGLGLVLATLAGVLQFSVAGSLSSAWLMVAVVYGAGQLLEGFVLTPRLVGERIGLHPLAVIFALLAFGQWFGLVGVLVALPVSAVLLVALRRVRQAYVTSDLFEN